MDQSSDAAAYEYEYKKAEAAAYSYGGAVGFVSDAEREATEVRQRFMSSFNSELMAKAEDGLINAEGVVNVEAMNRALYEQVEAAGASAATLALLGVATGQFTAEQAEAALKAAILQEQIARIADAVVGGQLTIDQALGALQSASGGLNAADLTSLVGGAVAAVPEDAKTVSIGADTSEMTAELTTAQADLLAFANPDEPYLAALDLDITGVMTGADVARRQIESIPAATTVTINWAQSGVDVITALRALGILA